MKIFTLARKYGPKAIIPVLGGLALQAHAALPASVGPAIDDAKADMLTAVGLVIAAMVAVWGLMKLGRKLGWL